MFSSVRLVVSIAVLLATAIASPAQQERADPALRIVTWQCEGNVEIVTTFLVGQPPTVRVEIGDSNWLLPLVPSDSGSKYSDGSATLWTEGNEASFESPELTARCVFADPAASTRAGLEGATWRLVTLVRGDVRHDVPAGVRIEAKFTEGRVSGRGACNRYFASYSVGENGSLDVGDVGATKMMCSLDGDLEGAYFSSLAESTRFAIGSGILTITTKSGSLSFTKAT